MKRGNGDSVSAHPPSSAILWLSSRPGARAGSPRPQPHFGGDAEIGHGLRRGGDAAAVARAGRRGG